MPEASCLRLRARERKSHSTWMPCQRVSVCPKKAPKRIDMAGVMERLPSTISLMARGRSVGGYHPFLFNCEKSELMRNQWIAKRPAIQHRVSMNWKQRLLGKWSWKRPFVSLLWIYFLLAIIAYFFGHKLLFRPPARGYELDKARYHVIEQGSGSAIAYTWLHPPNDKAPVIFFSHGNAEDLSAYDWIFDQWQQSGCGVFAYDYPGYGISEGTPTEASVNASAEAAWNYLTVTLGVPSERVIIVGRSVGCGPSLALAQKQDHAGLILISPFRSAFQSVTRVPIFFGDMFPNEQVITSIHTPLLIIHGQNDRVIPCSQGRALFDKSPSHDKTWLLLPDCGHNDLFDDHFDDVFDKMMDFAKKNGSQS